jgi:type VI secretion system secreted protein Hcp
VATVQDVSITKQMDKSSPKLAESGLSGKVFPKVEIHDTATYGDARGTFLKYELKNVAVTSHNVSASGSGNAIPTESLSLNFEEMKQTYTEFDQKGTKKGNVEMTWKVSEGTK